LICDDDGGDNGKARYDLRQTCGGSWQTCGEAALDSRKPAVVCSRSAVSL